MNEPSIVRSNNLSGVTTGGGTSNKVAKYSGASSLSNSSITDDGTTVSTSEAFSQGGGGAFALNSSGVPIEVSGVATDGLGAALTVKAPAIQNKSNAAPTTVSYTPAAAASAYRVTLWLDVTTGTTITFKILVNYTDPAGTAQTDAPVWFRQNSATALVNPTANTADRFYAIMPLATDNSATAITVTDNSGTYTTCAYRFQVVIERLQ